MSTVQHPDGKTRVAMTAEQLNESTDTSKWFDKDKPLPSLARDVLEKYSGIAPELVEPHARDVQARAFAIWPWPCLGYRFLEMTISSHPWYARVLDRLKNGQATYLDAGCCLGQDLRKLMFDGAPSSANLYGVDIDERFFDIGYELFADKEKLKSTFIAADLTKKTLPELMPLAGKIDVISAQSLFHAFTLDDQRTIAVNLVRLSRPEVNALMFGRQLGSRVGHEQEGLAEGARAFMHSPKTWRALLSEVFKLTDTYWRVQTWEEEIPATLRSHKWASDPNVIFLSFVAMRDTDIDYYNM